VCVRVCVYVSVCALVGRSYLGAKQTHPTEYKISK